MDNIILGGVLAMKKLVLSGLLAIGVGTANAQDVYCPQTITCQAGVCAGAQMSSVLIQSFQPSYFVPVNGTYSFIATLGNPAYRIPSFLTTVSSQCFYIDSNNNLSTIISMIIRPLTTSFLIVPNTIVYPKWILSDNTQLICKSNTATDCGFQFWNGQTKTK